MVVQVALVAEGPTIGLSNLTRASAALQKQVSRDFGPLWGVDASVDAFEKLEDVPLGYWPVIVKDEIGDPQALGFHVDKNGQPYALVQYNTGWETTASHETLEMLADPFGNRIVSSPSIKEGQGRVQYLVEVCDPSEAPAYGYSVNGLLMSDFYTPQFFDPVDTDARYSFTGAIPHPRTVLPGGYLSWFDPVGGRIWQQRYFGNNPEFVDLGEFDQTRSLRAEVDRLTPQAPVRRPIPEDSPKLMEARASGAKIQESSAAWVKALRGEIEALGG
jgi:hypothetical protein